MGRVKTIHREDSSTFDITLSEENERYIAIGCLNDGADDSIISSRNTEYDLFNDIGKIRKSPLVTLKVPLKDSSGAAKFSLSRSWTAPRTVLKITAGPFALLNIEYLVADAYLAVEDLLFWLSVLRHDGGDTKTIPKERPDLLDGSD